MILFTAGIGNYIMYLLTSGQLRDWDRATINARNIQSVDLMEAAATACVDWIMHSAYRDSNFFLFCGTGNNGADGLAIARLLIEQQVKVQLFMLSVNEASPDFNLNRERLDARSIGYSTLNTAADFPVLPDGGVVIDALFGTGLSRPLEGLALSLVQHLNQSQHDIISIDMPSGLYADKSSKDATAIQATKTLSFEAYKAAFMVAENAKHFGSVDILSIGLSPTFPSSLNLTQHVLATRDIREIYQPRSAFSHKGSFGHAFLVAGSRGKAGAAVMCAQACLRAGAGLVTCYVQPEILDIIQISVPEAMAMIAGPKDEDIPEKELEKFRGVGIGPGIGTGEASKKLLKLILRGYAKPLVIDADGLNIIAANPDILDKIPKYSILTPHPKEFERFTGALPDDFARMDAARNFAKMHQVIVVLKGHHTQISLPDGNTWFNNTGNAGMAKGGSGDMLTGILTGLLAQGYRPEMTAKLGVFIHGLAGDLACIDQSPESLMPTDLVAHLGKAFRTIAAYS